jgi:hypothetical protein
VVRVVDVHLAAGEEAVVGDFRGSWLQDDWCLNDSLVLQVLRDVPTTSRSM